MKREEGGEGCKAREWGNVPALSEEQRGMERKKLCVCGGIEDVCEARLRSGKRRGGWWG